MLVIRVGKELVNVTSKLHTGSAVTTADVQIHPLARSYYLRADSVDPHVVREALHSNDEGVGGFFGGVFEYVSVLHSVIRDLMVG